MFVLIVLGAYAFVVLAFLAWIVYESYREHQNWKRKKAAETAAEKEKNKTPKERDFERYEKAFDDAISTKADPKVTAEFEKRLEERGYGPDCIQWWEFEKVLRSELGWEALEKSRIEHAQNCEFCRVYLAAPNSKDPPPA